MRNSLLLTLLASALLLAGCPKRDVVQETPPAAEDSASTGGTSGVDGRGLEEGRAVDESGALSQQEQALLSERVVYFDYDSSEIRPEFNVMLAAHARFLVANPSRRVRLEGHTDERGSREYNIGLGERRAQSVRRALMLQGVADDQIATVSYGEERPAVSGSDEAAWAQNRRVELIYAN